MTKSLKTGITIALLSLTLGGMPVFAAESDVISSGITIDEINVSGMTVEEAQSAVQSKVSSQLEQTITFDCVEGNKITVTAADLGLHWSNTGIVREAASLGKSGNVIRRYKQKKDLQVNGLSYSIAYDFDKAAIQNVISEQCTQFNQDAINATMKMVDGEFTYTDSQTGYKVNEETSADSVYEYLLAKWDGNSCEVEVDIAVDEPLANKEDLLKCTDVLGTFTTNYKTSGSSRSANVANGCSLINGTVLLPGEEFSTLDHITPFTQDNGYFLAGSYLNGQVVESFGGGICQVSTTLYNAVLLAELDVTQRSNHSMIISYVDPSADAAIAESSGKDFRFVNSTEYPIYIEGVTTADKHITFNLYGVETRDSSHSVKYTSEVLERMDPGEKVYTDAGQPAGYHSGIQSAHVGYKARLWKTTYENGVEVSKEEVNKSTYNPSPRSVTIGVSTDNTEIYNMLMNAAASGSCDAAVAAANSAAAGAAPAPAQPTAEEQQQAWEAYVAQVEAEAAAAAEEGGE